jgi:hypothetical protein
MNHEVNSPAGDAKSKPLQKDLSKVHVRRGRFACKRVARIND